MYYKFCQFVSVYVCLSVSPSVLLCIVLCLCHIYNRNINIFANTFIHTPLVYLLSTASIYHTYANEVDTIFFPSSIHNVKCWLCGCVCVWVGGSFKSIEINFQEFLAFELLLFAYNTGSKKKKKKKGAKKLKAQRLEKYQRKGSFNDLK